MDLKFYRLRKNIFNCAFCENRMASLLINNQNVLCPDIQYTFYSVVNSITCVKNKCTYKNLMMFVLLNLVNYILLNLY